jgi:hypothetical protein
MRKKGGLGHKLLRGTGPNQRPTKNLVRFFVGRQLLTRSENAQIEQEQSKYRAPNQEASELVKLCLLVKYKENKHLLSSSGYEASQFFLSGPRVMK